MKIEIPSMLCLCIATLTSCAPTSQSEKNGCSVEPVVKQTAAEPVMEENEVKPAAEEKALTKNFIVLHDLITQEKNDEAVFNELINKHPRVIVDFYAEWCGPCRKFGPIFEKAATKERDVLFIKVNTERAPKVSSTYGVKSIPYIVLFKDGKSVMQKAGSLSEKELRSLIEKKLR
jgi:thioredoxin 1